MPDDDAADDARQYPVQDFEKLYGYAEAVRSGGLLFCSGQTGFGSDGAMPADPAEQYRRAFAALDALLARNGCGPADIVDLTSFHVDYPQHMREFMAAKAAFLGGARPAWTAVGVQRLGTPETLVEIKAIARIPGNC